MVNGGIAATDGSISQLSNEGPHQIFSAGINHFGQFSNLLGSAFRGK